MSSLTRSDFESAVKDALRHYTQADLLAGNALLHARVLTGSGSGATTPQALRRLLADTAKTLFASERDQRLYRVLELTYLNPAPKQEAAAGRLGLSFSTYRRHLTASVDRLIEWLWQQEQEPPEQDSAAAQLSGPVVGTVDTTASSTRPRLSIVILPFLNLSGDVNVDYLVDGIVDSLITDLSSRLLGSFVISRSTAFTYKGRSVAIRQVGQELGVRYVLEGSVLADPDRVRVNVQLIDAETDEHLWAERFDKERRDILHVQDEIVGRLSRSIGFELVRTEAARPGSNSGGSDAVDMVMRARALVNDVKRKENAEAAIDLFRQALELDPACVNAMVGIALARIYQVINLYRLEGRDALLDEAEDMVTRAMALSPDHFAMLKARGLLLRARGRFPEAIVATEALIARNPGEPTAYKEMGLNKLYLGATREAVEWFRRADDIAPRDPERWTWLQGLGRALMQLGHDAEAVDALCQAMDGNPGYLRGKAMLAAAEALAGNSESAKLYLVEYAATEPDMTVRRFAEQRSSVPPDAVSATYRRESERILDGLRRAGMPDGIDGRPLRGRDTIRPEARRDSGRGLSEPVSELIGREAELSKVADLMRTHRLVTLIGEGGIGKTRLGFEVARHLLPEFADGVRVAELAPLSDPDLVPVAVATAFGLSFTAGAISAERVADAVGARQMVLVLDNCEHVIDTAAGMATALLHTNPAIRVLATSREPLRTEGEYLYRVPALAVPAEVTEEAEELLRHGAVQLFLTRVRAADPHFSPDGRTAAIAAAICRRLDGIPLAIELAAARGAAFGIAEVASRLDDRFHLLTGGHRTAPPRQQTLRATLDWSYELLPEPERIVLRRLAIFAGNFTLAAVGAVATSSEITEHEVADCVANLVAKSLVTSDVGDATAQYRLIETTRAYALEKLIESSEFDSVARRHADYYRGLFERGNAEWEMRPTVEWMPDNGRQIDNLRAALDWSFSASGDASIGVALTVASVPLWMHLSLLDECRGRVERALSIARPESGRDPRREMKLYAALGWSLFYTKGPVQATGAAWASALAVAESLADTNYQLQALYGLWVCAVFSGEFQAAHAIAERFRSLAAKTGAADPLIGDRLIGNSLHYLGNQIEARAHIERMLANYVAPVQRSQMLRFHVDQRGAGLLTLARILWLQGFSDQALRTAQGVIEDGQAVGHVLSLCNGLALGACPIALFAGDLTAAEYFVAMLLDYSRRHGLARWHACGRCFEGVLLTRRGDIGSGLRLLRNSLNELSETGSDVYYTAFLGASAKASATIGDSAQGLEAIDKALERAANNKEQWYLAELLRIKGELLLLTGAPKAAAAAEDHFWQALDWARRQGALSWELRVATSLARLKRDQGRSREGYELLTAVYDRFTEGFGTADLVSAKTLLHALR
jgi:predicted ATPase/TolB-like protein/Flp pilus assembly protein TadD